MEPQAVADTAVRVVGAFADAFQVWSNRATRSQVDKEAKDATRWAAQKFCQGVARRISANLGISDADKRAIFVNPLNHTRTKVVLQRTSPVLTFVVATPLGHTLRYADSLNPTRVAKPVGADFLELWVAVTERPVTDVNLARFCGQFARNLFSTTFEPHERGLTATYFGRWGRRNNQHGMWSLPLSVTILA
jgi:hypothetical protein